MGVGLDELATLTGPGGSASTSTSSPESSAAGEGAVEDAFDDDGPVSMGSATATGAQAGLSCSAAVGRGALGAGKAANESWSAASNPHAAHLCLVEATARRRRSRGGASSDPTAPFGCASKDDEPVAGGSQYWLEDPKDGGGEDDAPRSRRRP